MLLPPPSTTILCMRCRCFCDVDQVPWGLSAHDNQDPPLLFTRACHHLPAVLCWQLSLLPTIQHPTLLYSTLPVCHLAYVHVHMLPYYCLCVFVCCVIVDKPTNGFTCGSRQQFHHTAALVLLYWCTQHLQLCDLGSLNHSSQLSPAQLKAVQPSTVSGCLL
jgi:hypothetical protein